MKIGFLGDSITEGTGASCDENGYVSQIARILNIQTCNYGIGGTRIAKRTSQYKKQRYEIDFNMRVDLLPNDLDYLFVFGGTNDYGHGDAPIGNIDDNTVWSFYGALNILVDRLVEKYGKNKIIFIIPIKRYNFMQKAKFNEGNLLDFVTALRNLLNKKGIIYLDLWELFDEPDTDGESEFFVDGLHPNDKGHTVLAQKIADYIKTFLKAD